MKNRIINYLGLLFELIIAKCIEYQCNTPPPHLSCNVSLSKLLYGIIILLIDWKQLRNVCLINDIDRKYGDKNLSETNLVCINKFIVFSCFIEHNKL